VTSFKPIGSAELARREVHLGLFACVAIVVLAGGMALLMYPAVFSNHDPAASRTPKVAYFGFCGLSCLLVAYLVDRQLTIQRLRTQMATDRKQASEALRQASADLLATMPNFTTFEDRLAMEIRRAAVAQLKLSVVAVSISLNPAFAEPGLGTPVLGDAAKAVSRRLREEDSIYILRAGHFGVILPGVDQAGAKKVSSRLVEGLSDAAGANNRFSFRVNSISYPEQSSSAHDLELVVCGWRPEDDAQHNSLQDSHAYN
jgi:GGDEF domain-containing protein